MSELKIANLIPVDPLSEPDGDVRRATRGKAPRKKRPSHRDNPTVTFRAPRDHRAKLVALAKKRGISVNALMREIVAEYLVGIPNGYTH